jgi:ankyrin repeat protein
LKSTRAQLKKALWAAVSTGDIKSVDRITRVEPDLINAKNAHHATPLGKAVIANHLDIVQLLVERGAELVWQVHGKQNSLLSTAASLGHREIGQFLIDAGIAPGPEDAAGINDTGLLQTLLTRHSTDAHAAYALHYASSGGAADAITWLITRGNDVNITNHRNQSPLYLTTCCVYPERRAACATILLAAGANPDIRSSYPGNCALHCALETGDQAMVQLICDAGADIDLRDHNSRTPLHIAVQKNLALVRLVLKYAPDLTLTTNDRRGTETALDNVHRRKQKAMVKLLENATTWGTSD